jgi:cytochrome P450
MGATDLPDPQELTDHSLFADGTADPYSAYAAFRQQAPVQRVVQPDGLPVYYVSQYTEARAALNDDRLAHHLRHAAPALAAAGMPLDPQRIRFGGAHMLHADPPEHPRLRKLVSRAFTAARVESLRPAVQGLVDELVGGLPAHGEADLVAELAYPLPVLVICELLGVPREDRTRFRQWSNATLGSDFATDLPLSKEEGRKLLRQYMSDLVLVKSRDVDSSDPDDAPDMINALIRLRRRDGDDALTEEELIATAFLLLIAGHESTVNFLGLAMHGVTTNPDLRRRLRDQPEAARPVFEELLRHDGPVQRSVIRTALTDVELGGVTIPAGSIVCVGLASANRDECQFARAAEIDPDRAEIPHLGFGHGRHFCLGAPLARLEGQLALTALAQRYDAMELAVNPADLRWRHSFQRGLEALPVRLSAADSTGGHGLTS